MMTWSDVQSYIAANFPVSANNDRAVTFGWPADKPTCAIDAVVSEVQGRTRLFFGVPICAAEEASPEAALALNAQMFLGSLVSYHQKIIYRHVLVLDATSENDLGETIQLLGQGTWTFGPKIARPQTEPKRMNDDYAD